MRNLEHVISIEIDQGPVDVYLCGEELVRLRGLNAYLQLTPIHDLTVEVRNTADEFVEILGVQFNHPNMAGVKKRPGERYEYTGGMLPGQSFQVSWNPACGEGLYPSPTHTKRPRVELRLSARDLTQHGRLPMPGYANPTPPAPPSPPAPPLDLSRYSEATRRAL